MKKLMSIKYNDIAVAVGMLVLRLGVGVLMIPHGYGKLVKFDTMQTKFMDFLGLGPAVSLGLVIFAEFFCSILLVAGLFTRLAVIPPIVAMSLALFKAHSGDAFGDGQTATLFLMAYIPLLLIGPGKFSLDGLVGK